MTDLLDASTVTATHLPPRGKSTEMLFSSADIAQGQEPKYRFEKNDSGSQTMIVEGMPVFRTGTFRDSMGFQMTFEEIHIDQMILHHNMLKNRGIFADVPVRSGHPGFLIDGVEGNGKVVGWHTDLRAELRTSKHDGKEYYYLLADYEILDEEAQKAISSGLWRNRSSEIGTYVSNDEAEYTPTYMGVAYVDIPAVEGLNTFSKDNNVSFIMEEGSMTKSAQGQAAKLTPPTPPTPPVVSTQENDGGTSQHSASTSTHTFSIGGQETTDFGAVQEYIKKIETEVAALRGFQQETVEQARADFVTGLAATNRVAATEVEGLTEFAKSLSDEQFETWSKAMTAAPTHPALGQYGSASTETEQTQATGTEPESASAVDEQIVRQHKRAGMSTEKIKQTASYGRLIEANPNFKL